MFLKLVKHELHELLRVLLPIFGGLLLFAGVTRGLIWLMQQNDNPILSVTGGMFIGLFFMSCVACVILTAVLLLVRFAKSVHGDEGYLTHTLPVGVHSILCSRLLVSVLFLAAAMGTAILSVLISTWRLEELSEISEGIGLIFESAGLKSGFWWTILASVFVQTVTTVLMVFAAISIGHSFNRGKVGFSILFYFALNHRLHDLHDLQPAPDEHDALRRGRGVQHRHEQLHGALHRHEPGLLRGVLFHRVDHDQEAAESGVSRQQARP